MTTSSKPQSPTSRLAGHALVEALIAQGIDTCFGVPGDTEYQLGCGSGKQVPVWSRAVAVRG